MAAGTTFTKPSIVSFFNEMLSSVYRESSHKMVIDNTTTISVAFLLVSISSSIIFLKINFLNESKAFSQFKHID